MVSPDQHKVLLPVTLIGGVPNVEDHIDPLLNLVESHREYTDSTVAEKILAQWPEVTAQFVKVMPVDYKRVLA